MPTDKYKKILIAPLDWGLGHTTRCIPIIRYMVDAGHHVTVACNAVQQAFIKENFPDIDIIPLKGYNVRYNNGNGSLLLTFLRQMPRLLRCIRREHKWLLKQASLYHFDGIISDNRYGLFHPHIPSVIMTHQLQVQTGVGTTVNNILRRMLYKYLNRFSETWVPDIAGTPNLSGKLGHPNTLPRQVHYLGLLSRLEVRDNGQDAGYIMILLSGPEPQRSILSNMLWQQVQQYKGKVIFIEGSNNATQPNRIPEHITYYKQINNEVLLPLLSGAAMVICRSGYSTLMDLVALNKKAIVIPTPGQTEQEYLGEYLHKQGIFYCTGQRRFNLQNTLAATKIFPFNTLPMQQSYNDYKAVVERWVASL